jgi:regulator of sigma E protease
LSIVIAIIVFSLLVFFHELGHFSMAKACGIGVTEFAIGMGPTLLHYDTKKTRYSIKLIPFGGFCQMVGELEEDGADRPADSFNAKSPWARLAVILAGPVANFILAWILALIVIGNVGIDRARVTAVVDGMPAKEAGLEAGDVIVKINQKKIVIARDMELYLSFHNGEHLEVTYLRDGQKGTISIDPAYSEEYGSYMIGIQYSMLRERTGIWDTIRYSAYEVRYWINYTLLSLKMLFTGQAKVSDMSGAVGIVDAMDTIVDETKEYGTYTVFLELANFCILLSANLGVVNLLPIPALDGGRGLFILIEILRGKPLDQKKEGMVHAIGLALLMALMVVLLFNDVIKIFF